MFVDTHTHLYDEAFSNDKEEAITRAIEAGVTRMIVPDTDSSVRESLFKLTDAHPGVLWATLGLHPEEVKSNWKEEMALLEDELSKRSVCAVGEIGLDYHWSIEFKEEQKEVFRRQLQYAVELDLPVIIHNREATQDTMDIIRHFKGKGLKGVFHAFCGSIETFSEIQKSGDWYVGIGGVATFKNAGIGKILKDIPLERMLLETDSPYLAPVPKRGQRNESAFIPLIAAKIAAEKSIGIDQVGMQTSKNAELLFNI